MGAGDRFRHWLGPGRGLEDSTREDMLERLRSGGVRDERVLEAMARVPREEFVTEGSETEAYADRALAIGYGQTISQPLMVAVLVQALAPTAGERVLDIGTGSGYQAAVIAACGAHVISVERLERLAVSARRRLERLGFDVEVVEADGSLGLPEQGPYDAIAVAASAPRVPEQLVAQLAEGGRLCIPVAAADCDRLIRVRRYGDQAMRDDLGPCRFVPLLGAGGFPEAS
ncbi:MAG: protein-L-isoaspartate(D-aspartate) O-methyltransferase [Chloroflexi bacterium]|nr:MAG: protein-L-isoaspartate(D-aspartate) O-methyltransferase [Chloroflexota bacterium]